MKGISFGFKTTAKAFKQISNYLAANPASTEVEPLSESALSSKTFIAQWGTDNNFPEYLDNTIAHSEDMEGGIQTLTEFGYGIDINTVIKEVDENGNLVTKPFLCPEFEELKESYNFQEQYTQRAFYNFFRYANVFIEFSIADGKIVRLFTKDSPFCRISTLDGTTGMSKYMLQSASMRRYIRFSLEELKEEVKKGLMSIIPLIDVRNPIFDIKEKISKKHNLVGYHIKDYSPGDPYYGKSPWYPLLTNGWLDIAKAASIKIRAYYENLITLAFHIGINMDFFKDTINDWDDIGIEGQSKALMELQQSVDDNLSGKDKSYKSIFTQMRMGQNQQMESMLDIKPLDNPMRDSTILKDSQQIASVIQASLRLDDSIINGKNTGSKEADAGSEKRSAANLLQLRLSMVRDQMLYPLYIMKHVNGWDKRIKFQISTNILETTDNKPTGQSNVTM